MSVSAGLDIIEEGLIFYYDMTNGQKSFKGKPTTNTCTFGTYNYGYNSTKISDATPPVPPPVIGYPIYKITSNDGNDSQQILYTANVDQVNGGTYTHSAYVYLESGTWVSAGQHWNPWDYGTQQYIPKGVWTRIEDPVTNSANNYGNVAMCYNTNGAVYVTGSQYELGSFASPLVNTSRSNTQSILDLTNNNTITVNSLTYASDGTFSFNGAGNNLSIGSFSGYSTNITCEAWFKTTSAATWKNIVCGPTNDLIFTINGNLVNFGCQGSTPIPHANYSTTTVNTGAWFHAVATYNGSVVNIYVNGNLESTNARTGNITSGAKNIGSNSGGSSEYFNGTIGSVKIYNRALTNLEVQQNFNSTRGRYGI